MVCYPVIRHHSRSWVYVNPGVFSSLTLKLQFCYFRTLVVWLLPLGLTYPPQDVSSDNDSTIASCVDKTSHRLTIPSWGESPREQLRQQSSPKICDRILGRCANITFTIVRGDWMRTPDDPSIHQVSAAGRPSDFVSQGKANASQCNARSLLLPPRPPSSPSNNTSNQGYPLFLASHTELHSILLPTYQLSDTTRNQNIPSWGRSWYFTAWVGSAEVTGKYQSATLSLIICTVITQLHHHVKVALSCVLDSWAGNNDGEGSEIWIIS